MRGGGEKRQQFKSVNPASNECDRKMNYRAKVEMTQEKGTSTTACDPDLVGLCAPV